MALQVDVIVNDQSGERPPPGTRVHVELRDTSLADAPARVLAQVDGVVGEGGGERVATVELPESADALAGLTVWAHADVSGSGTVSKGDYITMQSHPVPSPEHPQARLPVTLRPVR